MSTFSLIFSIQYSVTQYSIDSVFSHSVFNWLSIQSLSIQLHLVKMFLSFSWKHQIHFTHSTAEMTEVNASLYLSIFWPSFWADFNESSLSWPFNSLSESSTSQNTEISHLMLETQELITQVFISELNSIFSQLISLKTEILNLQITLRRNFRFNRTTS